MEFEEFKKALIKRSNELTTNFFMDESTEFQFIMYYNEFLLGQSLDEIIKRAYDEAYNENT